MTATGASANGNAVVQFDALVNRVRYQGGIPTHWFVSYGVQRIVNGIVSPGTRYIMSDGSTVNIAVAVIKSFLINGESPEMDNAQEGSLIAILIPLAETERKDVFKKNEATVRSTKIYKIVEIED